MARPQRKDINGQMQFAFGRKKTSRRVGHSLAEKRAIKQTAFRLARQAYAILKNNPKLSQDPHYKTYKMEIGQFIGQCRKNRTTFVQAQSKIGMITGLFEKLQIKYRL